MHCILIGLNRVLYIISSPNKLSGTGFVFVLALNKKISALLKFDSVKSALLGKIYSLKPLCYTTADLSGVGSLVTLELHNVGISRTVCSVQ